MAIPTPEEEFPCVVAESTPEGADSFPVASSAVTVKA